MTRLSQYTLLALALHTLLACSTSPLIKQNNVVPTTGYAATKVLQPEAWQCFQAINETQWHCQKDSNSPLTLSLSDIAREKSKAKKNTQFNTYPASPTETAFIVTQSEEPLPTHVQPYSQEIPMLISGKLYNARNEVLNLPARFYTLQLLAVKDKQKLIDFVRKNAIEQPIYLSIANQETEFHILLAGIFENFEDAANQSISLANNTQVQPWVRQLGALQNALADTQKELRVSTVP